MVTMFSSSKSPEEMLHVKRDGLSVWLSNEHVSSKCVMEEVGYIEIHSYYVKKKLRNPVNETDKLFDLKSVKGEKEDCC